MSKTIKKVSIILIVMIMFITSSVFAANTLKFNDVTKNLDAESPGEADSAMGVVNKILGFLQWGSIIGGIIIITVLGIKYMMGSLEEKSEYKKSMIPLVIGIIVVVSATTIAKILFNTFK